MLLVFYNDLFYITKFFGAKAQVTGLCDRIEPEFRGSLFQKLVGYNYGH